MITWKMLLENLFLQSDHQDFIEEEKVRLTDKIQATGCTKQELYWMRTLKTLYPDGLNIESDYQQSFQILIWFYNNV